MSFLLGMYYYYKSITITSIPITYSDISFSCHVRTTCKAFVLFISGILSDLEGISHMMLLFWPFLQTPWLEVVMTTVITCLESSLLLIFAGSNVSRIVLLELLPIPPSTHIPLLLERLFIVVYQAPFCFQDDPIGVQVPKKWLC